MSYSSVSITAGSGTDVSTDVIASVNYQRVKLVAGAEGATAAVGHAEDAAHTSGDGGILALAVRSDTAAQTAGTDGDYCALVCDSAGKLHVNVGNTVTISGTVDLGATDNAVLDAIAASLAGTLTVGSHAVTNAGTFAVQAAQSGTWNITNISGTISLPTGAATAAKQPALGTAGTASADVITVQGIASMTALVVDGSGVTQPVSGTVTANLSATDNAVLDTIDTSTAAAAVSLAVMDDWDNAASDGVSVSGDVAHDTADAGEPVKIGAKATTGLSGATMVADADRVNAVADVDGAIIYRPYCPLPDAVVGNASNTDGTSTEVIAAQSAGVRTYVTTAILTNTSATMIYVELKDGTTVMARIPVPATGGATVTFPVPLRGTAATAWNYDPSAAATTTYCTLVGFKSKV